MDDGEQRRAKGSQNSEVSLNFEIVFQKGTVYMSKPRTILIATVRPAREP